VTSQWELIVLAVVVVLLFGSKQVPAIARSLGRGVRDVRRTVVDVDPREDVRRALEAPEDESRAARDD
jgi:sec-independent protein translocase protein TatA